MPCAASTSQNLAGECSVLNLLSHIQQSPPAHVVVRVLLDPGFKYGDATCFVTGEPECVAQAFVRNVLCRVQLEIPPKYLQGLVNAFLPIDIPAQAIEYRVVDDARSFLAILAIKPRQGFRDTVLFDLPGDLQGQTAYKVLYAAIS